MLGGSPVLGKAGVIDTVVEEVVDTEVTGEGATLEVFPVVVDTPPEVVVTVIVEVAGVEF